MPQTRRNFTPEFKLEIAKKSSTNNIAELYRKFGLGKTVTWR